MSRDGAVRFDWAGVERRFKLGIEQLANIQEACGASPVVVLRRLRNGEPRVMEPSIIIREGLLGGGTDPETVRRLVKEHCLSPDFAPWGNSIVPATLILAAGLYGVPDDDLGESQGEAAPAETPPPTS